MLWLKAHPASLRIFLLVCAVGIFGAALSSRQPTVSPGSAKGFRSDKVAAPDDWRLYDSDPNHLWNRLYRSLYQRIGRDGRQYGYDELDPLLWPSTTYLLKQPAYDQAIARLDEFLATHAETAITDPLHRAILQRDLWAVFDWTTTVRGDPAAKLNLQRRLVQVMKRLALSSKQVAALPNTYAKAVDAKRFASAYDSTRREQSFLPPDLFDRTGPWVSLSARGGWAIASVHLDGFSGRSVFLVFLNLPDGRKATLKYLRELADFPRPWLIDPDMPGGVLPNPELPQFPPGTQLLLVRKMLLIDNQGNLQATNIVEDLQIRIHRTVPSGTSDLINGNRNQARMAMDVYEFKLSRSKLFVGEGGGLRAVMAGEKEFPIFQSHGIDLFELASPGFSFDRELRETLTACPACHSRPGIHSLLSRKREGILASWDPNYEVVGATGWKERQYNWGLLQGLWNSQAGALR